MRKFVGASSREALQQVRQALGPDALIVSSNAVAGGVEIIAMAPEEMARFMPSRPTAAPAKPDPEPRELPPPEEQARVSAFNPPRVHSDQVVRGLRSGTPRPDQARQAAPADSDRKRSRAVRHDGAGQYDGAAKFDGAVHHDGAAYYDGAAMAAELKAMRGLLETQLATLAWREDVRRSPLRMKFTRLLHAAGFSPALSRRVLAGMPDDYSEVQGGKWLADMIARNIPVVSAADNLVSRGGVYAIVGPTGVGKTTTTAKLAARCAVRFGASRLALVTTDSYRIGAQEQLRTYGRILGVPVHVVQDESGLAGAIASLRDKHLVLIDTVGMGQRDSRVIEQVSLLANSGASRILVLSATAHGETLEDVVQAFRGDALAGCIVSKSDEAVRIGSVMDTVIRNRLPVHFVANGQRVPEDLHEPNGHYLAHRALKEPAPVPVFRLSEEEYPLVIAPDAAAAGARTGGANG